MLSQNVSTTDIGHRFTHLQKDDFFLAIISYISCCYQYLRRSPSAGPE